MSPGRFTHHGIYAQGSCSGERGNILAAGTYCYVAVCRHGGRLSSARRFGAHRGRRGTGHIVAVAHLQPVAYTMLQACTSVAQFVQSGFIPIVKLVNLDHEFVQHSKTALMAQFWARLGSGLG